MPPPTTSQNQKWFALRKNFILLAGVLQLGCGLVFALDVISEIGKFDRNSWLELVGVIALSLGTIITINQFRHFARWNSKVGRELELASGAFQSVIDHHFDEWGLSDAERDVALFSIKGMSTADIAILRQTRPGTIKAQTSAIYRKSGVSSRAELLSVMVEELLGGLKLRQQVGAEGAANAPTSQP